MVVPQWGYRVGTCVTTSLPASYRIDSMASVAEGLSRFKKKTPGARVVVRSACETGALLPRLSVDPIGGCILLSENMRTYSRSPTF